MLDFDYCECGCKCYSASSKGMGYSIYWNLGKSYKAYNGHSRYGSLLGDFKTYEEAKMACQKHFDDTP